MGFDAYGPTQRPTPPKPVTDGGWFGDLAARQRRDDRALERTTSVRATGRLSEITPSTNPDLGGVPVGGTVTVDFTPPDGGVFLVTARLDVTGLPAGATISIIAIGVTETGPNYTTTTGGGDASANNVDAASTTAPLTVTCGWEASGSPTPADFKLTFICAPF